MNSPIRKEFEDVEKALPNLLLSMPPESWGTLDVDYESPRVERVWVQVGLVRVYLHRIHPCKTALMHPHPWPSAIRLLQGQYEMGIGYGPSTHVSPTPPMAAVTILSPGSYYEMSDPNGWHYVRPLGGPSMSLMVTGTPWKTDGRYLPGQGANRNRLSSTARDEILDFFRAHYPPR